MHGNNNTPRAMFPAWNVTAMPTLWSSSIKCWGVDLKLTLTSLNIRVRGKKSGGSAKIVQQKRFCRLKSGSIGHWRPVVLDLYLPIIAVTNNSRSAKKPEVSHC